LWGNAQHGVFRVGDVGWLRHCFQDSSLPGPFEYPLVSNAIQVQSWLPNLLQALMMYSNEFEWKTWTMKVPLMPRFVIITDPRCVKWVLETKFDNYVKGPIFHKTLVDLLGNGIFNSDGKRWLVQRKTASHLFSNRILSDVMLPVFGKHADMVCEMLDDSAKAGTELDMQDIFFRYTLDSSEPRARSTLLVAQIDEGGLPRLRLLLFPLCVGPSQSRRSGSGPRSAAWRTRSIPLRGRLMGRSGTRRSASCSLCGRWWSHSPLLGGNTAAVYRC
jgi:hypothetical protein